MATWRKREDLELEVECGVDSALVRLDLDKLDKAGWLQGVRVYIQTSWEESTPQIIPISNIHVKQKTIPYQTLTSRNTICLVFENGAKKREFCEDCWIN